MRVKSVLIALLGLGTAVVLARWQLVDGVDSGRPKLVVRLRRRVAGIRDLPSSYPSGVV